MQVESRTCGWGREWARICWPEGWSRVTFGSLLCPRCGRLHTLAMSWSSQSHCPSSQFFMPQPAYLPQHHCTLSLVNFFLLYNTFHLFPLPFAFLSIARACTALGAVRWRPPKAPNTSVKMRMKSATWYWWVLYLYSILEVVRAPSQHGGVQEIGESWNWGPCRIIHFHRGSSLDEDLSVPSLPMPVSIPSLHFLLISAPQLHYLVWQMATPALVDTSFRLYDTYHRCCRLPNSKAQGRTMHPPSACQDGLEGLFCGDQITKGGKEL